MKNSVFISLCLLMIGCSTSGALEGSDEVLLQGPSAIKSIGADNVEGCSLEVSDEIEGAAYDSKQCSGMAFYDNLIERALFILSDQQSLGGEMPTRKEACLVVEGDAEVLELNDFEALHLAFCREYFASNFLHFPERLFAELELLTNDSNCFADGLPKLENGGLPRSMRQCREEGLNVVRALNLYWKSVSQNNPNCVEGENSKKMCDARSDSLRMLSAYMDLNIKSDPPRVFDVHDDPERIYNSLSMKIRYLSAQTSLEITKTDSRG